MVAGAGGNRYQGYGAGAGGGLTGGTAAGDIIHPGYGGTQTAGGAPSHNIRGRIQGTPNFGNAGVFGYGGSGPYPGGAGWYGGGSGGTCYVSKAGTQWAGAGGGSSYTKSGLCKEVVHTQGYNKNGNGWVTIQCLRGGVTIPNFEVVGSPTIDENYNVSGFSKDNYLKFSLNGPVSTPTNNFEVQVKFTTANVVSGLGYIIKAYDTLDNEEAMNIDITKKEVSTSIGKPAPSSWFRTVIALNNPQPNTTYWIKYIFDGLRIKAYNSLNGKDWNLNFDDAISDINSPPLLNAPHYYVGIGNPTASTGNYSEFDGSIDLSECYIKINGKTLWKGIVKS